MHCPAGDQHHLLNNVQAIPLAFGTPIRCPATTTASSAIFCYTDTHLADATQRP
jgi:hypothetical protein